MPLSRQNSATDAVMGDWSIWVRCHPGVTKHVLPFISAEVGCLKTSGILPRVRENHNASKGLRSKTLGVLVHSGRHISKGKDKATVRAPPRPVYRSLAGVHGHVRRRRQPAPGRIWLFEGLRPDLQQMILGLIMRCAKRSLPPLTPSSSAAAKRRCWLPALSPQDRPAKGKPGFEIDLGKLARGRASAASSYCAPTPG
jgi:hypothetical protein